MKPAAVVPFPRHGIPGYFALSDLPQRGSLSEMVVSTGWLELDEVFRVYPGQFVVITGLPGSGKSTFLFNLLANLSWKHKYKHWMYVPENEPNLMDKIELIFGSTPPIFGKFAHTECFVQSANYEHYNDEPRTIEWILNLAYQAWERDHINTVSIDPWNELDHARQRDESVTDYIGRCLRMIKMFGRETGCTMFVVAHPTKLERGQEVTLSSIENSAHWWNKSDSGLIIKHAPGSKETTVISAKVREIPQAGRPGHCVFTVDPDSGIFREQAGGGQAL